MDELIMESSYEKMEVDDKDTSVMSIGTPEKSKRSRSSSSSSSSSGSGSSSNSSSSSSSPDPTSKSESPLLSSLPFPVLHSPSSPQVVSLSPCSSLLPVVSVVPLSSSPRAESLVEPNKRVLGNCKELNTLYRFPGGISMLTVKNVGELNIGDFVNRMLATEFLSHPRIMQLMDHAGGQDNLDKMTFITLCANEVMMIQDFTFVEAIEGGPHDFSNSISINYLGKTKRAKQDGCFGFGVYKILDAIVQSGTEEKIISEIISNFNKAQIEKKRPLHEHLMEQFVQFYHTPHKDRNMLSGPPFLYKGFAMVEETKEGIEILQDLGFEDWSSRTTNGVIFVYRRGEIFVYTTGNGYLVIKDFIDPSFPLLVEIALLPFSKKVLSQTPLFHNRKKFNDNIITISLLSQLIRQETPNFRSTNIS